MAGLVDRAKKAFSLFFTEEKRHRNRDFELLAHFDSLELGDRYELVQIILGLSEKYLESGNYNSALDALDYAMPYAKRLGNPVLDYAKNLELKAVLVKTENESPAIHGFDGYDGGIAQHMGRYRGYGGYRNF